MLVPADKPDAPRHAPVVVLGAGLTGMAAAIHLRRAGVGCRVIEREDRAGGLAITTGERGYRFDRTGHLLHVKDAETRALALGWIGPEHRVIARRAAIWSHGVYTRYPFQANVHGLPPAVAYECVMGFLARRAPPRITTFEDYCLAHFGEGITRHFMRPYNARQLGVSLSEISAAWCSRFVPVPTLEDVIAGAVGLADRELGYNAEIVYPERGIGQLAEGMARELGDIELGVAPRAIHARARTLSLAGELRYDVLVSSLPLPALVALVADAPDAVRAAAAQLRSTRLHYLDVALRGPCEQAYHWIYVPEAKYPFYRVGCYSHFSPAMAPAGKASLYVELVDRAAPDLATLLPEVARGLVEMGLIRNAEAIVFARARTIEHAYVIFDEAHEHARDTCQAWLAARGILSAGRYGGWNYSSMADALAFGKAAATEAMARL